MSWCHPGPALLQLVRFCCCCCDLLRAIVGTPRVPLPPPFLRGGPHIRHSGDSPPIRSGGHPLSRLLGCLVCCLFCACRGFRGRGDGCPEFSHGGRDPRHGQCAQGPTAGLDFVVCCLLCVVGVYSFVTLLAVYSLYC